MILSTDTPGRRGSEGAFARGDYTRDVAQRRTATKKRDALHFLLNVLVIVKNRDII